MVFLPDPGFLDDLRGQDEFKETMREQAEGVGSIAKNFANRVMPSQPEQFEVSDIDGGARLTNTDYGAHLDEFGSAKNPPNAPMRRAVRAAGIRLEEEPKA